MIIFATSALIEVDVAPLSVLECSAGPARRDGTALSPPRDGATCPSRAPASVGSGTERCPSRLGCREWSSSALGRRRSRLFLEVVACWRASTGSCGAWTLVAGGGVYGCAAFVFVLYIWIAFDSSNVQYFHFNANIYF